MLCELLSINVETVVVVYENRSSSCTMLRWSIVKESADNDRINAIIVATVDRIFAIEDSRFNTVFYRMNLVRCAFLCFGL